MTTQRLLFAPSPYLPLPRHAHHQAFEPDQQPGRGRVAVVGGGDTLGDLAAEGEEEEAKHERKRELLDAYVNELPLLGAVDYSDPEVNRKFDAWAAELGLEAYQLKQYVRKRLKQRRDDAMGGAMASLLADETMDSSL